MQRILITFFAAVLAVATPGVRDKETGLIPAGPPPGPGSYFRQIEGMYHKGTMPALAELKDGMPGKFFQYTNGHQPLDAELGVKTDPAAPEKAYMFFKGAWCPLIPWHDHWEIHPRASSKFNGVLRLRKTIRPNKEYAIVGLYSAEYPGQVPAVEAVYFYVQHKVRLSNVVKHPVNSN